MGGGYSTNLLEDSSRERHMVGNVNGHFRKGAERYIALTSWKTLHEKDIIEKVNGHFWQGGGEE